MSTKGTTEDDVKILQDDLQKLTDSFIEKITEKSKKKKTRYYKFNSFSNV